MFRLGILFVALLLLSPLDYAFAKGRGLALKGKVKDLQIELNSTKLEFLFTGLIEIKDETGINFNFKTEVKDFKISWDNSLLWESDFCKGRAIGDAPILQLPFTVQEELDEFLACVAAKDEVYVEVQITPVFKLVLEGKKLKAIEGNLYLFFRQASKYPYVGDA